MMSCGPTGRRTLLVFLHGIYCRTPTVMTGRSGALILAAPSLIWLVLSMLP